MTSMMGWSWPWSSSSAKPSEVPLIPTTPSNDYSSAPAAVTEIAPPPPPSSILIAESTYTPLPENVRIRKQLTLLFAGPIFLSASLLITRRALRRKAISMIPPQFHPNNAPPVTAPSGPLEALEALNLATMNIGAFAITLVGGSMFALDVCNIEELQRKVRGVDGMGGEMLGESWKEMKRKEKEAEEEMEEWMVSVLARKELKEKARRKAEEEV